MSKIPDRKFKDGESVWISMFQKEPAIIKSAKWTGFTWMYSFEGLEMRCGEGYLSKPIQ